MNLPSTLPPGAQAAQMKIDEPDANTTYVGWARRGVATSTSDWLIKKISVSGNVTSTQWASNEFDQEWDERASLTYT